MKKRPWVLDHETCYHPYWHYAVNGDGDDYSGKMLCGKVIPGSPIVSEQTPQSDWKYEICPQCQITVDSWRKK